MTTSNINPITTSSYSDQEFINLLDPKSASLLENEFESGRLSPDDFIDRIQKIAKGLNLKRSDRKKLDKKIAKCRGRMKKIDESLPPKAEREKVNDKYFESLTDAFLSLDGNEKAEKIMLFHFAHKALREGDQEKAIENVKKCPAILKKKGPQTETLLHLALVLKRWKFVVLLDEFWASKHLSAKDHSGDTPLDILREYSSGKSWKNTATKILEKLKDRVS